MFQHSKRNFVSPSGHVISSMSHAPSFLLSRPPVLQRSSIRPFPSSLITHYQNEAKCKTFLVKMSFIYMRMKNNFHIKGLALNLVLIQRHGETRKSPIEQPRNIILCCKGRLWDTIVLGCSQFTLYNLLVVSLHGLIVEKYGAALREMRLAIEAWIAPSYPYITYFNIT